VKRQFAGIWPGSLRFPRFGASKESLVSHLPPETD
jgi:hypothetical protein